jgi:hypothetical protein
MRTPQTFRNRSGLIAFAMDVPLTGRPTFMMRHWVTTMLRHAEIVGRLRSVSFDTRTEEDYRVWHSPNLSPSFIVSQIEHCTDVVAIFLRWTIVCTTPSGGELDVEDALLAYIEFADRQEPSTTDPLEATIILDTDIYAAVSWGDDRDNRVLARLNAPLFNKFLRESLAEIGVTNLQVDAPDYLNQVNTEGFVIPE